MDTPPPDLPSSQESRCPHCQAGLTAGQKVCPACFRLLRTAYDLRRPATTLDIVLAVGFFCGAVVVTAPVSLMMLRQAWSAGRSMEGWAIPAFGMSLWNGWLLGFPMARTALAWLQSIRRHDDDQTFLWRTYWVIQLATLLPLAVLLLFWSDRLF